MTEKDPVTGIVNPAFSLSIKMSELDDFEREISQLQSVGHELDFEV